MIIRGGTTLWRALRNDWPNLLFFFLLAILAEQAYLYVPLAQTAITLLPMGMLVTAMSIFLAFQVNQSYDRWWEARILWGGLVNLSRSFGRQVTTLMTPEKVASLADPVTAEGVRRELVYRHLAYVNALRMALRTGAVPDEAGWKCLGQFLAPAELQSLKRAANVPTQLIQRQGERLAAIFGREFGEVSVLIALDGTLSKLCDIQGGCERIKRQAFPDRFSFHTRAFVWLTAMLIPFHLFHEARAFDPIAIITETILAFIFVTIDRLGRELRDPFENRDNDTPMTALCRTIEIDLRQQLGEVDVPSPLAPVGGILM